MREEVFGRLDRRGETCPDDVAEGFVRRVGRHALVEAEQGQRRNHSAPRPTILRTLPVETPDQQHILVHRADKRGRRNVQPGKAASNRIAMNSALTTLKVSVEEERRLLATGLAGGGFVEYRFDNSAYPGDESHGSPKLGYATNFSLRGRNGRGQVLVVGSGIYPAAE